MDYIIQNYHLRAFPQRINLACKWEGKIDDLKTTDVEAVFREFKIETASIEADRVRIKIRPLGAIQADTNIYNGVFFIHIQFTMGEDREVAVTATLQARDRDGLYSVIRGLRMIGLVSNKDYSKMLPMCKLDGPLGIVVEKQFASDGLIVMNGGNITACVTCWQTYDHS